MWPLFGLSPLAVCVKGMISWDMLVWAKNAENVKELLRLDQRVQGVKLEFVAIDSISPQAQWRIISNGTQIDRTATVHTVYQHMGEHYPLIYTTALKGMVMQLLKLHFLLSVTHFSYPSQSPCPLKHLYESLVEGYGSTLWLRIQWYKISWGAVTLFKSPAPFRSVVRIAGGNSNKFDPYLSFDLAVKANTNIVPWSAFPLLLPVFLLELNIGILESQLVYLPWIYFGDYLFTRVSTCTARTSSHIAHVFEKNLKESKEE